MKRKFMKGAFRYDWTTREWECRRPMCWTVGPFEMHAVGKISFPVPRFL